MKQMLMGSHMVGLDDTYQLSYIVLKPWLRFPLNMVGGSEVSSNFIT
jgi:hypothetical protein